ncbi:MAG: chorismate lyase [Halioglobus sp.]
MHDKPPIRRIQHEPDWRTVDSYTSGPLPPENRYWLLDDGSLTGRLVKNCRGRFNVQRLYQGWQVPLLSERRLLSLPPRELALIREVVLRDGETPIVFARSVFPLICLQGRLRHLRQLQNKALGEILFKNPDMHRSPFELAKISPRSDYLPADMQGEEYTWGRRSRFVVNNKALMVSEVFLPAFKPWPRTSPVNRTQRGKVNAANAVSKQ